MFAMQQFIDDQLSVREQMQHDPEAASLLFAGAPVYSAQVVRAAVEANISFR